MSPFGDPHLAGDRRIHDMPMKRCLPDEANGSYHQGGLPFSADDSGPRKRFLVDSDPRDDDDDPSSFSSPPPAIECNVNEEVGINLDYVFNEDEELDAPPSPEIHYPFDEEDDEENREPYVDHRFDDPWPPAYDPPLIILEDDGPPPGIPLACNEDTKLLWTPIGQAKPRDMIRCMICRAQVMRYTWTTHMRRQHAQALLVCPYGQCGWKNVAGNPTRGSRHILRTHDTLSRHCKECPEAIFDSESALWKHECQVHFNWPRSAFIIDTGEDPLHEDDEGGSLLEDTADTEEEDFCWRTSVYHWSTLSSFSRKRAPPVVPQSTFATRSGSAASSPKPRKVGATRLGHFIVGRVPW